MSFICKNLDAGGVAWSAGNVAAIEQSAKKDLGDFRAYERGIQIGRVTDPGTPITDEPERNLDGLAERHRLTLSGLASGVSLAALNLISRRPDDLNTSAILAKARNEIRAAQRAAKERITPAVVRLNETRGEYNRYLAHHGRGLLSDQDYSMNCTMAAPMAKSAFAIGGDTFLNFTQYISVMPQGLPQAFATSFASALCMAVLGAFGGTSLRYFNYREPKRRKLWRIVFIVTATTTVFVACTMAQFRVLLDTIAGDGTDAAMPSLFSVAPSIVGLPVLIGCLAVSVFTAIKFSGGRGTPWARYGDQAHLDRAVRMAEARVAEGQRTLFRQVRDIIAEAVGEFREWHAADRTMLQSAMDARDKAILDIRDLTRSDTAYFNLITREKQRFRDGVMQIRRELKPDDFPPLPQYNAEGFPDPEELGKAVEKAEAIFATRTKQLAKLEEDLGALEEQTVGEFGDFARKIKKSGEETRQENYRIRRGGEGAAGDAS